jgi:hypothetical protein
MFGMNSLNLEIILRTSKTLNDRMSSGRQLGWWINGCGECKQIDLGKSRIGLQTLFTPGELGPEVASPDDTVIALYTVCTISRLIQTVLLQNKMKIEQLWIGTTNVFTSLGDFGWDRGSTKLDEKVVGQGTLPEITEGRECGQAVCCLNK